MERQEVVVEGPITVAEVTLIPVARVSLNSWQVKGNVSFFGVKQAMGVVVVSPSVRRAFRASGEEVPLDRFIQEAPGIEEILEKI